MPSKLKKIPRGDSEKKALVNDLPWWWNFVNHPLTTRQIILERVAKRLEFD